MRTRTLLLLAVGCGLVILVAGVLQLLRIATQDEPSRPIEIGAPVQVGDLTITVEGVAESAGEAVVVLQLGGVADDDGTADFRLVAPGVSLQTTGGEGSPEVAACAGTTVETQRCSLTFDVSAVEGSSRVLLFRRGDAQVRWELRGS
ncbi:MAG: hypothetical protein ACR2HQ_12180 [Ilumatobacteraceae bacterium]